MAQTPPSAGYPGRQLIVLGLATVLLFGMMFFAGTAGMSWTERLEPRLGLDLVGGTRVALQAATADGEDPEESSLELAREIIESRVNALGVEEAEVVTEGSDRIVVSVAGEGEDRLRAVGQPAELRFRKVLERAPGFGMLPEQGEPPEVDHDLHRALGDRGGALPDDHELEEQDPPDPDAVDPAQEAAEQADAEDELAAGDWGSREELEAAVLDKISYEAMQTALAVVDGEAPDPELGDQDELLREFAELTGPEVSVLPTKLQFYLEAIDCGQLNSRPAGSVQDPDQLVVACGADGQKSLLDAASVLGTDVNNANARLQAGQAAWEVQLDFTNDGQERWTDLTREAAVIQHEPGAVVPLVPTQLGTNLVVDEDAGEWSFDQAARDENNQYVHEEGPQGEPAPIQCGAPGPTDGNCLVAAVLDNEVVTAPEIRSVIAGDAVITGDFRSEEAQLLASQLRFGALPLTFEPQEEQTVTATLGIEYLRAGLLAAAIGVFLVLVYTFFYYRLLGVVILGSLIISSVLTYAALVTLGRGIGFTLTLAGISGFIVAVGIAADSFIIYFERLKDEIREGRTPRSAVPRAWVRARRTILTANAVTLLAAVTLYLLSAGQVAGFAFALGLATVLDLLVVFTFRHPIMTLLARTPAFLSPRVSGLGKALELDRAQLAALGTRTREASS